MKLRRKRILLTVLTTLFATGFMMFFVQQMGSYKAASVAAPTFSKQSGVYADQFNLELSANSGDKIYYTLDGSDPVVGEQQDTSEGNPDEKIITLSEDLERFTDSATTSYDANGVSINFAYKFRSISYVVPDDLHDWTSYDTIVIDLTCNQVQSSNWMNLQVAPVIEDATASYEEAGGRHTRIGDVSVGISYTAGDNNHQTVSIPFSSFTNEYNYTLSQVGYLMIGASSGSDSDDGNTTKNDSITIHSIKLIKSGDSNVDYGVDTETLTYNSAITVTDRKNDENVLCSAANCQQMYNEPNQPGKLYVPEKQYVNKATVVKAMAVDAEGNKSDIVTKTYFVGEKFTDNSYEGLPIISMVTDPYNLLNPTKGIYCIGDNNNYTQEGKDWERPASVTYFDKDRNIGFSTTMGIRIHGGYTRHFGQKSFNVYFREELGGLKNLKGYELFPGATNFNGDEKTLKIKNFMLRNGGNDCDYTKLQDVFIQSLVKDRNFTTQSYQPCVLFLNGEYWGLYNIQEKYGDNWVEEEFGVDKENVIVIKNGQLDEGQDGDINMYYTMRGYADKDMTNENNYNEFCELVDIQSMIDYYATEIYIGNHDWPNNNFELWRARETSSKQYEDGKWRWMLYDTEYSLGIYGQDGTKVDFDNIQYAREQDQLFNQMMNNEKFKQQFVVTMLDLYNNNFAEDNFTEVLNKLKSTYEKPFTEYFHRFVNTQNPSFNSRIDSMTGYLTSRREKMINYLKQDCNMGDLMDVKVNQGSLSNCSVTVNTSKVKFKKNSEDSYVYEGKYIKNKDVNIKANSVDGYVFDHWEVTGGTVDKPTSASTTVKNASGVSQVVLTPVYKKGIAPTPTPTPKPTPTPTPKPPVKPTPKPAAKPTATPKKTVSKIVLSRAKIKLLVRNKTTLQVKLLKVKKAKGYQIMIAQNKSFSKGRKIYQVTKTTKKITRLNKKKKYYVKVRAYAINSNKKKVYGKWSLVKKK